MINKKFKVLTIGAHPDDIEFSMGGTVAKLVQEGHVVYCLDITDGEPTPYGSKKIRKQESKKAAEILGVSRKTLGFPNRYLLDNVKVRKKIAEEIRIFRPDIIFAHYPEDSHPDHWAASIISMAARFYGKLSKADMKGERHYAPRFFYFFSVHLRISPSPDFCIDISETFEQKIKSLLAYESQFKEIGKPIQNQTQDRNNKKIEEFIKTQNSYWGNRIGTKFAEPFYSPEIIGLKNLDNFIL